TFLLASARLGHGQRAAAGLDPRDGALAHTVVEAVGIAILDTAAAQYATARAALLALPSSPAGRQWSSACPIARSWPSGTRPSGRCCLRRIGRGPPARRPGRPSGQAAVLRWRPASSTSRFTPPAAKGRGAWR